MSDGLHVLFVVNNYPPHLGGVQLHVQHLARGLVEQGAQASVVTLERRASGVEEDDAGVRVIRLPSRFPVGEILSFPLLSTASRVEQWARVNGVTAISTHTRFFPMSALGVGIARRLRIPSIHTEHGSDFVRTGTVVLDVAARAYDLMIGRQTLRRATRILAVSKQSGDFVARLSGRPAETFHNAIELSRFLAVRDHGHASPRLVFVGRLVPGKGWKEVLDVYRQLLPEFPELELDFVGDGPQMEAARRARRDLPRARVQGRVDPDQVPRFLAGAVLINPTTLSEGFQTVLIEALAAGGQVVTYDVPGARELRELGPQTEIVGRSLAALTQATRRALVSDCQPLAASDLAPWDWARQTTRYAQIVRSASRH